MMKSFLIITLLALQISSASAAEKIVTVEKPDVIAETGTLPSNDEKAVSLKAENQIPLNIDQVKSTSESTQPPTRLLLTGVIISCLLGAAYYFVKKYKNSNTINKSNMQIKVLSQHYLGPKKSLAIVRVAGESILIGVTDSNISMIKSLSLIDDEIPAEIPQNFADTLNQQKPTATKATAAHASAAAMDHDELDEEFSFSGLKDSVSKKLKSMRSI